MIRTLIVDDQDLIRDGLRAVLEAASGFAVVGEAADGAEAVRLARSLRPEVVLLDIRMPGMDGLEATAQLVALDDPSRILVLTTFDLDEYVFRALRAGASGFLLKDVHRDRLVEAVHAVAAGESLLAPSVTRRLIESYVATAPGRPTHSALRMLTPREAEILQLIARGQSNAEIAATMFLGESLVKSYVSNLLTKIGLRDRVHAVVFVYETGFTTRGGSQPPPR
jgi:DNA-binding NarL/FixJ family response regulator